MRLAKLARLRAQGDCWRANLVADAKEYSSQVEQSVAEQDICQRDLFRAGSSQRICSPDYHLAP